MGDPLTLATGIAGLINLALEVTQLTHQYVQGVRNAAKDVDELLEEVAALVDVLRRFYCFLQDDKINIAKFDKTSVIVLTHGACDEKLKTVRSKLSKRGNGHRIFKALMWPFIKKEHRQTVQTIHQWVQTFQFALTIDGCQLLSKAADNVASVLTTHLKTLEETKKISQAVPVLQQSTQEASTWIKGILEYVKSFPAAQEDILDIKENVETLKRLVLDDQQQKNHNALDQKRQKLFDWLSALNFGPKQVDVLGRRSPSTGEWLINDLEFDAWLQGNKTKCLWCSGIPGAGKTVLTSIVIDHLQSNPLTSKTAVAYVYFDYKNRETQNVLAVFTNLLRQILEQVAIIPKELELCYDSQPSQRKENNMSIDQCFSFMQTVCQGFDRVFLIFDALDECTAQDDDDNEQRSKILTMIARVCRFASVFVTSRPHINLTQEISDCACLEIRATESDMRAYLEARIAKSKILCRITSQNPSLESYVIAAICSKANGMFLLVRLQVDSLANQTSARNVYRALECLPDKLKDTFHDAMERTGAQPKEHSKLAIQVISWIFFAKRPLLVAELREALSVEYGDKRLDRSGCHEVDLFLDVCCGLVSIDEQDNVIRLVHYSFQQYLEENCETLFPRSQRDIAMTCLTYLMLDDFSPEATDDMEVSTTLLQSGAFAPTTRSQWQDSHRFFSYVASYWGEHVKGSLEKELEPEILCFFGRKTHLLYSLQQYNRLMFRNLEYDTWPHEPSSLHLTAYWGLSHITGALISEGADVHAVDIQERTPLVCAALNGHGDVVYVLLDGGADVNASDAANSTALHAAVINDHVDIARLFLLRGADPNRLDKDGFSPMCLAASNGDLSTMDLLLRKGANPGKLGEHGLAPIEIASRGGHGTAVQWLLMRGVDVNSKDVFPLTEAVYANHPQIVRILLDAEVQIDAQNRLGHTALGTAIKHGNRSLIERLVAAGADVNVNATGSENESPLQAAVRGGDEAIVKLLINFGARVNNSSTDMGTILQIAVCSQSLEIVNTVLARSSSFDVNLDRGTFGATPLHLAIQLKDPAILFQLLNYIYSWRETEVVDASIANSFNITPLHQAVYLGWRSGIDVLVEHGVDPELRDLYGQTCLDWAVADKDMFRRLGGPKGHRGTDQVTQRHCLESSIRDLVSKLLVNPDRRGGRRIDYHYLGHCLLRIADIEEARTSFEQQISDISSRHQPRHNILCHNCGGEDITGSRFVCHTCADIDLCGSHMKQYTSRSPDVRCRRHRFLEVPGPGWQHFRNEKVNGKGETIDEWLARLLRKYPTSW